MGKKRNGIKGPRGKDWHLTALKMATSCPDLCADPVAT